VPRFYIIGAFSDSELRHPDWDGHFFGISDPF
jgi:hypothetical protein